MERRGGGRREGVIKIYKRGEGSVGGLSFRFICRARGASSGGNGVVRVRLMTFVSFSDSWSLFINQQQKIMQIKIVSTIKHKNSCL